MERTQLWSTCCYNPEAWFRRAIDLLELGYPELAAGDLFKARLLIQAILDLLNGETTGLGQKVTFHSDLTKETADRLKMNILKTLGVVILALEEPSGLRDLCKETQILYPSDPRFKLFAMAEEIMLKRKRAQRPPPSSEIYDEFMSSGRVSHARYPFMAARHTDRGKDDIDTAKKALDKVSTNCTIAPRNFAGDPSLPEAFGVYAIADMKAVSHLFNDETVFASTDTTPTDLLKNKKSSVATTAMVLCLQTPCSESGQRAALQYTVVRIAIPRL